jgi:hypothetical protein
MVVTTLFACCRNLGNVTYPFAHASMFAVYTINHTAQRNMAMRRHSDQHVLRRGCCIASEQGSLVSPRLCSEQAWHPSIGNLDQVEMKLLVDAPPAP